MLLHLDVEIAFAEAGDCHADAVVVLAHPFDVVGRVGWSVALDAIQRIEQRTDPVSSSIWTLAYRKIHGTALTILTYLVFMAVMWCFFEWG